MFIKSDRLHKNETFNLYIFTLKHNVKKYYGKKYSSLDK